MCVCVGCGANSDTVWLGLAIRGGVEESTFRSGSIADEHTSSKVQAKLAFNGRDVVTFSSICTRAAISIMLEVLRLEPRVVPYCIPFAFHLYLYLFFIFNSQ